MRRGDRLFEIIQLLRTATKPLTAADIATELEVTPRTIYRDMAALQARRVPIEGAPGIGYVLRRGFDLPPLMFTIEEVEAIIIGAQLVRRTGDSGLQDAAATVLSKVKTILPDTLRQYSIDAPFFVSGFGAKSSNIVDLAEIRDAIRAARKIKIAYEDERGQESQRIILPIAVAYYVQVTLIAAWCELRSGYRHFRADRITAIEWLDDTFSAEQPLLLKGWLTLQRSQSDEP